MTRRKHEFDKGRNIVTVTALLNDFSKDLAALSDMCGRTIKAIDRNDADLEEYLQPLRYECNLIRGKYVNRGME